MLHIYWLRPSGKPLSKELQSWAKKLGDVGAKIETFKITKSQDSTTQFFNPNQLKVANVVFTSGFLTSNYSEIFRALRTWAGGNRFPIPICWVGNKPEYENIDNLVALGFDEFISSSDSVQSISNRVKLRQHHIHHQIKTEKLIQEQTTKNAKTETILSQREEFLSVCSHDLRSPLGLIQSSLSLVLNSSDGNLTEVQTELIHRARRQSSDAMGLVNDLLDVMSFEQGLKPQYQLFHLDSLLRPFHKDYQFQSQQKGVHFHYNNPLVDWRVLADSDRIKQLMQNLVVNAMKFTEKGKNIYLNVSQFHGRRKSNPPYPMMVVSIKDEGKGIPQKELQKIFDRFTQIKEHSKSDGRGLGLTVAKQISTLHDGNIWVESEEGVGSTFFVLFPHVISRTMSPDFIIDSSGTKTILIVEPLEKRRESCFEILKRWGYKLIFANDGVDAVTLGFYHLPQLVILSENLAKMGEEQVVDTLKSDPLTAHIKVALAGDSPEKYDVADCDFPFDGVLKTPFSQESFEHLLRTLELLPVSLDKLVA